MLNFTETFRFQAAKETKLALAKAAFPDFTGPEKELITFARSPENLNVEAKKAYAKAVGDAAQKVEVAISVPETLSAEDLAAFLKRSATERAYILCNDARIAGTDYPAAISFETVDDFFPEVGAETAADLTEEDLKEVPRIIKDFIGKNVSNPGAAKFYLEVLSGKRSDVARYYIDTPASVEKRHNNAKKALSIFGEKMLESADKEIAIKLAAVREKMVNSLYKKFSDAIAANKEMDSLDLG